MIDENKLLEALVPILDECGDMYFAGRIAGCIMAQPKISLENKTSDWFPVSEKEPSKYGVYLVSGHIHRKQKEHIRVAEYFGKFEVANNFVVTAWQPLPKPYEVEDER